jgi:hypothetical protein
MNVFHAEMSNMRVLTTVLLLTSVPTVDTTAKSATRDLNITMKTAVGIIDGVMDNVHALYPQVGGRHFLS